MFKFSENVQIEIEYLLCRLIRTYKSFKSNIKCFPFLKIKTFLVMAMNCEILSEVAKFSSQLHGSNNLHILNFLRISSIYIITLISRTHTHTHTCTASTRQQCENSYAPHLLLLCVYSLISFQFL